MGTGFFPGVKSGRGVTLTRQPLPVPWSWKSRAIPLLPLWAVRPVQSLSACTRVYFTFTFNVSFILHRLAQNRQIASDKGHNITSIFAVRGRYWSSTQSLWCGSSGLLAGFKTCQIFAEPYILKRKKLSCLLCTEIHSTNTPTNPHSYMHTHLYTYTHTYTYMPLCIHRVIKKSLCAWRLQ